MTTTVKPVHRLPLQPLTAVAVLRNVAKPEVATTTLARLVEVDPALTAMVLRMANSPLFGFNGRVSSARQATVLLGTKTVGSLAVGGTASLVFGTLDSPVAPGAWAHTVAVACSAAAIARLDGVNPEEAFTAGLLHNAAMFVQMTNDQASPSCEDVGEGDSCTDDDCLAGRSADLLKSWGLPSNLVRAVRQHAAPIGGVTDQLARTVVIGHALAPAVEEVAHTGSMSPREAFAATGLGSNRFDEVVGSIRRDVDGIANFLETEAV